jgi:tryptophan 2,3-dioxygenase
LVTAYQWYELWFRVLVADLRALATDNGATFESVKLLRRCIALFQLFDLHANLIESIIVRELELSIQLRVAGNELFSDQFSQIVALARRLPTSDYPGLVNAAREYAARVKSFRARFAKLVKATLIPKRTRVPSYADWLRLSELFDLQDGPKAAWTEVGLQPTALMSPEHISADENMFIVVHQCFEIWFQVILAYIDRVNAQLFDGNIADAARLLRHAVQIQRLLNRQIEIPATMLPLDFMRFRSQKMERDGEVFFTGLSPASGTESYQFREIEIVCGLRDDTVFRHYLSGNEKIPIQLLTPRQSERLAQPSLADAFRHAAMQRGIENYDALFTPANVPNPNADLADLADTLIEFDEAFRFWRLTHVSMVEKMIGAKSGTGFLGPEYLMETAGIKIQEKNRIFEERQVRHRFFEELWQVRSRMGAY